MLENRTMSRLLVLSLLLAVFTSNVQCNIYEFTIGPNEESCFDDYFVNGTQPSMNFQSYRLNKATQNEELEDLTKAGVIEKRKGTAKVVLKVESTSGVVYTPIKKTDQLRTYKVKETGRIQMCFKNHEKSVAFIIFDLRTGIYAGDVSNIPSGEETDQVLDKLESIRARLDNSLSLYRQMESYEEKHLRSSNTVLSGVLLVSQIMIAAVAIVGWGITMLLEKSLKQRKIV